VIWPLHSVAIGLLASSLIYPLDSRAQTRDAVVPGPAFEVASVKHRPNFDPQVRSDIRFDPGMLTVSNFRIDGLIINAFGVPTFRISGLPKWANSEFYDVTARANTAADKDQLVRMLQTLLADRFKLKAHWESRELPSYVMTVGKNGAKLQKAAEGQQPKPVLLTMGQFSGKRVPIERIVAILSSALQRPVIDRTGLTGEFDLDARWPGDPSVLPFTPEYNDALISGIQDQLGLKLESQKAPVEILVIDSIERPSEN